VNGTQIGDLLMRQCCPNPFHAVWGRDGNGYWRQSMGNSRMSHPIPTVHKDRMDNGIRWE